MCKESKDNKIHSCIMNFMNFWKSSSRFVRLNLTAFFNHIFTLFLNDNWFSFKFMSAHQNIFQPECLPESHKIRDLQNRQLIAKLWHITI